MQETDAAESPNQAAGRIDQETKSTLWGVLGHFLPLPTAIAGVIIGDAIRDPCSQIFCGLETGFLDLTAGYFVGWLLSAISALCFSSAPTRGKHFLATVKGAAILPAICTVLYLMLIGVVLLSEL